MNAKWRSIYFLKICCESIFLTFQKQTPACFEGGMESSSQMFVKRTTSLFLRNIKRKRKKIGEEVPVKKSKPSLKHVREIKKKE